MILQYIQYNTNHFASFIGYEEDIFEVISNFHVLGAKFGGKKDKFGRKSFQKFNSAEFMEFFSPKSDVKSGITKFIVFLTEHSTVNLP